MTNDNRLVILRGPLWAVVLVMAIGCGDDATSYDLLSGDRSGASVFSRSDLRVRLPSGEVREVSDSDITSFLEEDCATRAPATAGDVRVCVQKGRKAHIELCVANRLLEIADSPAAQPLRRYASKSEVSTFAPDLVFLEDAMVLPPERAQQAAMLTEARDAARRAQTEALAGKASIDDATNCSPDLASKLTWPALTIGSGTEALNLDEHLAVSMIEASQLVFETSEKLVRASLAAADRRMGDAASPQDIARRVWVGDDVLAGRFDVARAVASGREGLPAALPLVRDHGMCGITPLNGSQKRALGALRVSGIAPSVFASTSTSTDAILTDVGDRLAAMYNNTSLATMTVAELLAYLDVTPADVAAARRYLVLEFAAFGRVDVTIPNDFIPGTPRSAATVYEPSSPDAAYWGALASLSPANVVAPFDFPVPNDTGNDTSFMAVTDPAPLPAVVGEDQLLAYSIGALEVAGRDVAASTALGPDARSLIGSQLPELERAYRGLVRTCVEDASSSWGRGAKLRIYHRMPTAAFLIVKGHAGLQCATTGFVEGVSCNTIKSGATTWWASVKVGTVDVSDTSSGVPLITSFSRFRDATVPETDIGPPGATEMLFVVYNESGTTSAGAGQWKVLTGQAVTVSLAAALPVDTRAYCVDRPAIDSLDEAVKQILEPSTTSCTQPATSCAGIPSNQLIPLENDLTSDGDPVESSWRHYLDSALASAAVADELGEQLIREGLEQDARVESAVDELAAACGARINLDGLVGTTAVPRIAGACPAGTCAAFPGYTCNGELQCVVNPVELAIAHAASDQDAARLRRCLGVDDIAAVSLGAESLCAWKDTNGDLCGRAGTPAGLNDDCPYAVTVGAAVCPLPPAATGYTPVGPTKGLGYFAEASDLDTEPPPPPEEPPCNDLALLRSPATGTTATALFQASYTVTHAAQYWATPAVQAAASRLNWRPLPGDGSEVTLDGSRWIRVGSLAGATTGFPCDASEFAQIPCLAPSDPSTGGSLFCVQNVCLGSDPYLTDAAMDYSARKRRAMMNDRLARAVIAARIIAGVPLSGVEVPTYPNFRDLDAEGEYWARFRGATWSQVGTMDSHPVFSATNGEIFAQLSRNFPLGGAERAFYVGTATETYPLEAPAAGAPQKLIPAYAEYTLNAYDGSGYEIFDAIGTSDEPRGMPYRPNYFDPDDWNHTNGAGYDYNLPLLVRALPTYVDAASAAPSAAVLWSGMNGTPLRSGGLFPARIKRLIERLRTRGTVSVSTIAVGNGMGLSNYWRGIRDTHNDWYDNIDYAADADLNYNFSPSGNRAFIGRLGFSEATVLDAVELICAAQLDRRSSAPFTSIPEIRGIEDLTTFADYLRFESGATQGQAARVIFENYPADALVNADTSGAETGGSGDASVADFGVLVATLRTQMNELADHRRVIALELSLLSNDIETLQNALQGVNAQEVIINAQLTREIANQITSCVTAVADVGGLDFVHAATQSAGAATTCANSVVQVGLAIGIERAQTSALDAQEKEAINQAEAAVRNRSRGLGTLATQTRSAVEQLRGTLRQIEATRARGRRALAKALMLDADETGAEYALDTAMRRRLNTTAIRYQRAFGIATRQAYIAKLAIEQRIGMPLSSITTPMRQLDEAPSGWQMDVCSMTGIDYDRIRDSETPPSAELPGIPDGGVVDGATAPSLDDFSGEYIGDYVRKLQLVMESYPFDFPYAPSSDTAVVSLRDEIMHIRTECPTPVNNQLYQSGHLDARPDSATGAKGWETEGCPVTGGGDVPDGGVTGPAPVGCITTYPIPSTTTVPVAATCDAPVMPTELAGAAQPFEVRFGDWSNPAIPTPGFEGPTPTRLVQWITLDPGIYRLSWFTTATASNFVQVRTRELVSDPLSGAPDTFVDQLLPNTAIEPDQGSLPVSVSLLPAVTCGPTPSPPSWKRAWRLFQLDRQMEIGVAIDRQTVNFAGAHVLAGMMLEDVSSTVGTVTATTAAVAPSAYVDTGATLTRNRPTCEDSDGSEFRRSGWTRGCSFLCRDGFGTGCRGVSAEPHCYWETQFGFTQRQIERGELIRGGGFAYGNFNYRIEDIALNVVGTYARDCEQARALGYTSSVCYANGTVPYSLYHTGDFTVRNHAGDDYDAPLFNGAIEYARALATEDYITNPISSASASRLEPFRKREFSGRPINGTYTLRIWDDPAVDFSSIDDIQIVLNYRYWTRFGR